ncbi:sacsin N-terminal ATP-binding-like domain-containing protein [Vibrio sp. MEBiC08052]|uniref:sacsin N-terminal ATP-binding-like domain-containing protein n=1 Tax=Vibrio sp. MEBiC08052 TaxID=1761910 RepID=UPI0007406CDD|nr:DUF3883 domain-containing protein [Vibrio sp. MEBiC08052]KUI97521.1 hypothetical protein VRK_33850 [Vibrio sp. MEBiC08052]
MNDSEIPLTSEQWFEILVAEESQTKNSYFAKPSNLIRDYRSEKATGNDYEGREILELLQNAADQAKEANVEGKVVIELLPQGLVVANNGNAFSIGGVKSLQNAHLSPKRLQQRQYIGCKGLGFRSILNWTKSPIILSSALALAYSEKVSKQKLKELTAQSAALRELVSKEQAVSSSTILPTLPFPGFSASNNLDNYFCPDSLSIKERCDYWLENGFTTAIGIPFEREELFTFALQQINSLRPEMLLFVEYLDEVRFIVPDEKERIWSKDGNDSAVMVVENDEPLGIWKLFRSNGLVDSVHLDNNENGEYHYELIIAVPQVIGTSELKSSPLFTYFPTEIELPLPIVCHATLELDQSRNHIIACKSNQFVFAQLARFMAEVAEHCAVDSPIGCNAGFRTVMPMEAYSQALAKFNLETLVIKECQSKAIVPTLSGRAVRPKDALIIKGASTSWLPSNGFQDIVPADEVNHKWLSAIGVPVLTDEDFRGRILTLEKLNLEERLRLILGLKSNSISSKAYSPSLFLSTSRLAIPDSETVYISPRGGVPKGLPNWTKLWFLDTEMQARLSEAYDAADVRVLQNTLKEFGLREYSFSRLIQDLRAQANRYKKEHPEKSSEIENEFIKVIYGFYLSEGEGKQRPVFPERISIELPSQSGALTKSECLYFGAGYGLHGEVMQRLYSDFPEKLVASPKILDSELEHTGNWGDFLEWIGVAKWPREITVKHNNPQYLDVLTSQMRFPVKFGYDYVFNSLEELRLSNIVLTEYLSLDKLDEILSSSRYPAILAWLHHDERIPHWLRRHKDHAKVEARKHNDRNLRQFKDDLPSYIQWQIQNTYWVLGAKNSEFRPKDCVITEALNEAIFPKPTRPSDTVMLGFDMEVKDVLESWRKSGVITSIAELTLEDIYNKLIELPELQPSPSAAKTLYRWMLNAIDSATGEGGDTKLRFFQSGKMWGNKAGSNGYFSIEELYHTDSDGLPHELLEQLAIVDLPYRVGGDKVKNAFGIQSIERSLIKQTVHNFVPAPSEIDLDIYFQQVKPFFIYLRTSQSGQAQYMSRLSRLKLKVCSQLHVQMQFKDIDCSHELSDWGWLIDGDFLYIRSSESLVRHDSDMLADAIGEALASLFRIANGGDFARLFRCRRNERLSLLSRILGEKIREEQIISVSTQDLDETDIGPVLVDIPVMEELVVINNPIHKKNSPEHDKKTEEFETLKEEVGEDKKVDEKLLIKSVESSPKAPAAKQKLRVKKYRSSSHGSSYSYNPVNGDAAELKIIEIEECFDPPRYALAVGQYMGEEGFGCDILSFNSAEERDNFKHNKCRDLKLVERFIEVKGRSSKSASIELRGNEKTAASRYSSKYYLYRLFQSAKGSYSLSVLRNPLNDIDAVEHSLYIHMDRSKHTEEFEVSTVIE